MKSLLNGLLQSVIALISLLLATFLAPALTKFVPETIQGDTIYWTITITLYFLVMAAFVLLNSIPPIRAITDSRAAFSGQFISVQERTGESIFGVFEIRFDIFRRAYDLKGTTINIEQRQRPIGAWTSLAMNFNPESRSLTYLYTGLGEDSRSKDDEGDRAMGMCTLEYLDAKFSSGNGRFQDLSPNAIYIRTRFERLTPILIERHLGKRRTRLSNYAEMLGFCDSYARSLSN